MYIKDRMRVRDSSGKEFDIEMDLKVEIQPAKSEFKQNQVEHNHFSNKFMCPISIPWKHAFSRKQVESGGRIRTQSSDDVFKVLTINQDFFQTGFRDQKKPTLI